MMSLPVMDSTTPRQHPSLTPTSRQQAGSTHTNGMLSCLAKTLPKSAEKRTNDKMARDASVGSTTPCSNFSNFFQKQAYQ